MDTRFAQQQMAGPYQDQARASMTGVTDTFRQATRQGMYVKRVLAINLMPVTINLFAPAELSS
jgi:hypothetical protein